MSAEASPSHVAGPANTDADEVAVEPMDCEPVRGDSSVRAQTLLAEGHRGTELATRSLHNSVR